MGEYSTDAVLQKILFITYAYEKAKTELEAWKNDAIHLAEYANHKLIKKAIWRTP